jgi:hypothetical protein
VAHILFYEYVDDIVERRAAHRGAHLAWISRWRDDGKLVLAGAVGSPPHGAAIVFEVVAELVTSRRIEPIALV